MKKILKILNGFLLNENNPSVMELASDSVRKCDHNNITERKQKQVLCWGLLAFT